MTAVEDEEEPQGNPIIDSFGMVARLMERAEQPWCVIGGAAMLLHGLVPDRFNDIDILIGDNDADLLAELPEVDLVNDGGTHRFRSRNFLRCTESPLEIEFMAGLQVRVGTKWVEVVPRKLVRRRLGEATMFVPAAPELARLFHAFGRDRDIDRAHRLEAMIKAGKQTTQAG